MSRLVFIALAAFATFCVVQDRVTAAAARRYVDTQRAALAGERPPVTIDGMMRPAIRASVTQGVLWGGIVAVAAGGVMLAAGRRGRE